jgi:hypothetical protein
MRRSFAFALSMIALVVLAGFGAASALAAGAISGTVTDAATGDPISPAFAYISQQNGSGWTQVDVGTTGTDGSYVVHWLQPGTYRVHFVAFGYGDRYFDGRSTWSESDPVVVADGQTTQGIDARMDLAPATVSGRVRDMDGQGVPGIRVRLIDSVTLATLGEVTTDGQGLYTISVARGSLHLYGKVEFTDPNGTFRAQYYPGAATLETAGIIWLVPGSSTVACDAELSMDPTGEIRGVVRGAEGAALPGIQVEAILASRSTTLATSVTTAAGAYAFTGLPVGQHTTYKLRFTDPAGQYLTEYYRRRTTLASAAAIPVGPGTSATLDADLRLKPVTPSVTGITGLVSTTLPDQQAWYSRSDATFSWAAVPGLSFYRFVLDGSETTPAVLDPGGQTYATTLAAQRLVPHSELGTGIWPDSLTAADLDADGDGDIVVADSYDDTIGVFLGDGTGALSPRVDYPVGTYAHAPVVVDMDGDGVLDVVVASRGPDPFADDAGRIAVLLGKGDGTLADPVMYSAPGPYALAVADLDGDGDPDVAATSIGTACVAVLTGNGDGTLAAAVTYPAGKRPFSVVATDLDGDDAQDLVVANEEDSTLGVLSGNGDGTFAAQITYDVMQNPCGLVADDFDGDGRVDIAVANDGYPSAVSVLRGAGDGSLLDPIDTQAPPNMQTLTGGRTAAGQPFVVAGCPGQQKVQVFSAFGASGFSQVSGWSAGLGPWAAAVGRIDGDAEPDIVVANVSSESLSVLLRDAGGFRRVGGLQTGADPVAVATGDVDGDGRADMITADSGADGVSVFRGDGAGGVLSSSTLAVGDEPADVATADLDGDGTLDIVTADRVSVLLGAGHGEFTAAIGYAAGDGPSSVLADDVDGDGSPDLLVTDEAADSVGVLKGAGDGTFGLPAPVAVGDAPVGLALADLDDDGHDDLVVAEQGSGSVGVRLGDGTGGFAGGDSMFVGWGVDSVGVSDVDRDGIPDVVATAPDHGSLAVLLGCGDGGLQAATYSAAGVDPAALALADFNGDALDDAIVTNRSEKSVSVLLARPDGGFDQPFGTSVTGWAPVALAVSDVDDDTYPDVVVAQGRYGSDCPSSDTIAIMVNTAASPSVTCPVPYDGEWFFHVQAVAPGGFAGPVSTYAVRVDTTPPITDATAPDGWADGGDSVQLDAADLPEEVASPLPTRAAGHGAATTKTSGVAGSQYSLDGGSTWTSGSRFSVDRLAKALGDGIHAIPYRSVDRAGNVEDAKTVTVRADTRAPSVRIRSAACARGRATVVVRVTDPQPCAGSAKLQFIVRSRSGRVILRQSGGSVRTGSWVPVRFPCRIAKGAYRCSVTVTDAAGNRQVKPPSVDLKVR